MSSASSTSGWRFLICCLRSLSERWPVPHALHRLGLSCFGTCSRITCLCMLRRLSFLSQNRHRLTLPCFSSAAAAFRLCSFFGRDFVSTQFSQEWVCRKVVVKHSIKSKSRQGLRHSLKLNKRRNWLSIHQLNIHQWRIRKCCILEHTQHKIWYETSITTSLHHQSSFQCF